MSTQSQPTTPNKPASAWQRGETWMIFTALSYAASNLFDRWGMFKVNADSFLGATVKCLPAVILAIVFILIGLDEKQFGQSTKLKSWKQLWPFFAGGLISEVLGTAFFLFAMQKGGVVVAVTTVQVWTFFAALMGVIFLKEKFRWNTIIGLLIAVAGLVLIAYGQLKGVPVGDKWYLGFPYALLAGLCWATTMTLVKAGQTSGVSRFKGYLAQHIVPFITIIPIMALRGNLNLLTESPFTFYVALFMSGLLGSTLAMIFMYTALRFSPLSKVIPINAAYPAIAAIAAWLIFKDSLNVLMLIGIAFVALGVVYSQRVKQSSS